MSQNGQVVWKDSCKEIHTLKIIWIVQAKANSEKMAELTIFYYLYDNISDDGVDQKKVQIYIKDYSKYGFTSL